jgi:integrase
VRRKGYPSVMKTFDTKAAAKRWARFVESEMDQGAYVSREEAENTSFAEALDRYAQEITPRKKGARQEGDRIKVLAKHALAHRSLASIRGADIASYRDERLAAGKSPITVNNELILISHLFSTARKEWGMESLQNPVSNVRKPRLPPGRDRRLGGDEERQLLERAEYPMQELIVLALETGMRQGELLALSWPGIDLKRRTVSLADTKSGDARAVPLSRRAVQTVKSLPRRLDGKLFPELSASAVSHKFRALCRAAEIEGLRFHDLRHEATSRLFELGLNPMEVAAITGHKTLVMLKRYTHLRAEDLARKLG